MPVLKIENLHKRFGGIKAVDGPTMIFQAGEITGLIGPNGSGKSTLVNLITGMFPYDSGLVCIGDHTRLSKIKGQDLPEFGITRTFQDIRLFEQVPVLDNILVVTTSRSVIGSLFEKHK